MAKQVKPKQTPEQSYSVARGNLLLVAICTAVNLLLLILESSTQFLFSAAFPSLAYLLGDVLSAQTGLATFRIAALMLGAADILLYLLCWIFSKKHRGFMIAALVLFALDCVVFLSEFVLLEMNASFVLDVFFHAWVLWALISGVRAAAGLRKLERAQTGTLPENQEPPAQA